METFESHQDMSLGTLLEVALLQQGLDQMDPEVPSHPDQSVSQKPDQKVLVTCSVDTHRPGLF